MNKKENHAVLQIFGLMIVIVGLLNIINHIYTGPIFIAFGMIMATTSTFKSKKYNNRMIYNAIIALTLAGMLIGEYFLVPVQNITVYVLLLIIAIGIFLTFYFSFVPQNQLNKREKVLYWTGAILFGLSFFSLMGFIYNDSTMPLMGVFALIIIAITLLIRRQILKDDTLKNESDEVSTTKRDAKEHWFKYKTSGIMKPIRWQGWACYAIILLLTVLLPDKNPTTSFIILVSSIAIVVIIAMLKSNFRESVREYEGSLKE